MDAQLEGIIQSIIQRLQGEIEPQRLVLFGSRVSGKADADSDLDLLVIAPSKDRPVDRRIKVRRLLGNWIGISGWTYFSIRRKKRHYWRRNRLRFYGRF
jgi:predicted nucleotidyltransferase